MATQGHGSTIYSYSFISKLRHRFESTTSEKNEVLQQQRKYLQFVHAATMEPVMRGAAAYGYVRERSGPLSPGVLTVEETVKSVIGRVYDKFHLVPDEILRYADHKVDDSVTTVRGAPVAERTTFSEIVKTVYSKYEPEARKLYERYEPEAKKVYERYEPMAKEVYERYEAKVEQCPLSAWWRLTGLPLFPTVVDVVLPKAVYCTEKYNNTIVAAAERWCGISAYLP
ncbi:unnamed protein product [Lupinus luteus]|uniref:Stress-related protein n=1 Tax=Lupinus luteus TaxID=3873 RepID=A0AAV1WX74_LUPLU